MVSIGKYIKTNSLSLYRPVLNILKTIYCEDENSEIATVYLMEQARKRLQ